MMLSKHGMVYLPKVQMAVSGAQAPTVGCDHAKAGSPLYMSTYQEARVWEEMGASIRMLSFALCLAQIREAQCPTGYIYGLVTRNRVAEISGAATPNFCSREGRLT